MLVKRQSREVSPPVLLLDPQGEVIEEVRGFLLYLHVRGFSPNTLIAYAHDLKHLYTFLGQAHLNLRDFRPAQAIQFLQHLNTRKGDFSTLTVPTINRILAAVSSYFDYLLYSETLQDRPHPFKKVTDAAAVRIRQRYQPFLGITTRVQPQKRLLHLRSIERLPRPMDDQKVQALLDSLTKKRDRAVFLLMLQGGLRPGEALGLHLEDIAYGRRRITIRHRTDHPKGVRSKSRVERIVDLLEPECLQAVSDYVMHERPQDTDSTILFLTGGKGKKRLEALSYFTFAKLFKRRCKALGLSETWITPHALRHTHATRMWEGGMRELTLQKRLGHLSLESTRLYTRVSDQVLLEEYQRVLGKKDPS